MARAPPNPGRETHRLCSRDPGSAAVRTHGRELSVFVSAAVGERMPLCVARDTPQVTARVHSRSVAAHPTASGPQKFGKMQF